MDSWSPKADDLGGNEEWLLIGMGFLIGVIKNVLKLAVVMVAQPIVYWTKKKNSSVRQK